MVQFDTWGAIICFQSAINKQAKFGQLHFHTRSCKTFNVSEWNGDYMLNKPILSSFHN
jgi:hypothetical protein